VRGRPTRAEVSVTVAECALVGGIGGQLYVRYDGESGPEVRSPVKRDGVVLSHAPRETVMFYLSRPAWSLILARW